ncbi:MAG: Crp/Fnr family transcriptional regulator [Methylophilales bacterium]|nr:Crp/Fnr family transcriptional regulator [Methylophilales bacterium]
MDQDTSLAWLASFPDLVKLDEPAKAKLKQYARIVEAPVGTIGYRETEPCNAYVMRLAGRSRVYKISESGREIVLYRVGAGGTCVLTTTCLLGRSHYPASTVVEEPIRDVIVPSATFHQLMAESEVFRRFVLSNYGDLISDLIVLVDEVAFHSIASRLAGLLIEGQGSVTATHQRLADELGSAREVVSRQLKEFERQGWVKLGRASIEVLDRAALLAQASV